MTVKFSKRQALMLGLFLSFLPFGLYWNAINNEYAIDDNIVVDGIDKVEPGFSAIPDIFTSFYSDSGQQSYGYRPIVSSTFAIEKQFFSNLPDKQTVQEKKHNDKLTQANISHFINILLYSFCGFLVLYVLKQIFYEDKYKFLPYLIVFIFLIFPIHTENVANIKSRDTLLMLLGMLGAISGFIKFSLAKHYTAKAWFHYIFAFVCILFALFSKRSALALLGMVPVILYYLRAPLKKIIISTGGVFFIIFIGSVLRKILLTGKEAFRNIKYFENPLLHEGTFMDRIATGFYSLFFYLKMMIWPKEFSFYYGYKKIPLINFSFWEVWIGILIFVPLAIYGIMKWYKREQIGLAIALWLGTSLGFINVVFPIVGVVADRFAFLPSLGFAMLIGVLIFRLAKLDWKPEVGVKMPKLLIGILMVVFLGYSSKIWARNPDFENYMILFTRDVETSSESAKVNVMLATKIYYKLGDATNDYERQKIIRESSKYFRQALEVYPKYGAAINNLAVIDINYTGNYEEAIELLSRVEDSGRDVVIFNLATAYYKDQQYDQAAKYFLKAVDISPDKQVLYSRLMNIFEDSQENRRQIIEGLEALSSKYENVYSIFDLWMASFHYKVGQLQRALYFYEKGLELDPDNTSLQSLVDQLEAKIKENNK